MPLWQLFTPKDAFTSEEKRDLAERITNIYTGPKAIESIGFSLPRFYTSVVFNPQETAEKICAAYLTDGGKVLASASDGFEQDPGFVSFVEANNDGGLYLCNATSDAMIWAFEPIGDPLSFGQQVS